MVDELEKKLKQYVRKALKQGYSKAKIRNSLQKVGYDIGLVDKSFKSLAKERTTTNILLALLVVVLAIGLFMFWKYYLKPKPLVFLAQEPKDKFSLTNKSILLMSWYLPLEAKQNELINLTTIWKSQRYVNKNYGIIFHLFDKQGNVVVKYFFENNSYPTSLREEGYQYMEIYSFNVPYLKPDEYYYKIGLWDKFLERFFYAYGGAILGNITIKENQNIYLCGLLVISVTPSSPAEKAGVKKGDVIIGINDKKSEFVKVKADSTLPSIHHSFGEKVTDSEEFELNTENKTYKIVKKAEERIGLKLEYKICNK